MTEKFTWEVNETVIFDGKLEIVQKLQFKSRREILGYDDHKTTFSSLDRDSEILFQNLESEPFLEV